MRRPRRVLLAVLPILGALAFAFADRAPQPAFADDGFILEVRLHGLFGLYMPENAPVKDGMVQYMPFYAIAPRATDPAIEEAIPSGQRKAFKADWLPAHRTAVKIPFRNLLRRGAQDPELPGWMTLFVGGTPTPDIGPPLMEFPCDRQEAVRISADDLKRIPVVLKASDYVTPAEMDSDVMTSTDDDMAKRVALRLVFNCAESLSVEEPRDGSVGVRPAFLRETSPDKWQPEFVGAETSQKRGGDLVFRRSVSGKVVDVRLRGLADMTLHPDAEGKVSISVLTLSELEFSQNYYRPESDERNALEHLRFLYALANGGHKKKAPYYYYGRWPNKPEPKGSPYCDAVMGRFTRPKLKD